MLCELIAVRLSLKCSSAVALCIAVEMVLNPMASLLSQSTCPAAAAPASLKLITAADCHTVVAWLPAALKPRHVCGWQLS